MKNESNWAPSKFVRRSGLLSASLDPKVVRVSSRLMADSIARFFDRSIPLHARGRLIDLGCGKVPLYEAYRPYVSEVVCVDWGGSPHETSHIDIEHDLNKPLPFSDGSFDTIILSDVLEHLPEPEKLWSEMARILRPGGKVLLNVPFYYWLHEEPFDFYRYTDNALKRFAERSNLTVLELTPLGGAPEIVADILSKVVFRYRYGARIASALQRFCTWFVGTARGRRLSESTSGKFPFAYAMVVQKS